jgi:hypothetical protein
MGFLGIGKSARPSTRLVDLGCHLDRSMATQVLRFHLHQRVDWIMLWIWVNDWCGASFEK